MLLVEDPYYDSEDSDDTEENIDYIIYESDL